MNNIEIMTKRTSSDTLWESVVNEGIENRVEVNQRMLIDKMLARYSSDFVVYRELIQNSDDAEATSFQLELTCDPTSKVTTNEPSSKQDVNDRQRSFNPLLDGLGQLFRNHRYSSRSNTSVEKVDPPVIADVSKSEPSEMDFHNCIITEIRTVNNGHTFTEEDWKRVATIAEGNTNVDAIGQFGVGFFSVFSYSERPMIQSGKYCLAFVWKNGKSLTTFRKELPSDQHSSNTSIILSLRNKCILQTKSTLETDFDQNSETKESNTSGMRPAKLKKDTVTHEVIPTMDLTQLKAYFTKVLSFTKHINELIIKINGMVVFKVNKNIKPVPSTKATLASKRLNANMDHNVFHFNSLIQTEQTFHIDQGPSITLHHVDVEASLTIDKEFHEQIRRVLKKSLPSTVHIQFLFPSNDIFEEEQWQALAKNDLNSQILRALIPLKVRDGQINPSGQVFIGLATHQTTGTGMHVFSHLIPTIERENLDLQDPYISIWNEELLASIGKITRFIYDQAIVHVVNNKSDGSIEHFNTILATYAFQTSVPNTDIGRIILDGFFSSREDILVPVKRSPSDTHLSLIPSSEAFLTTSKYVPSFLPIPIVPYEIGKNDFFKTLKSRRWIEEINSDVIQKTIRTSILSSTEFIALLRWLCSNDVSNRSYVGQILSHIRFREARQSPVIELKNLEFYDTVNIPLLPLPNNVLPSNIVNHFAREDLKKRLSLTIVPVKNLVEFYLDQKQHDLLKTEQTSSILLSFLSQHWNKLTDVEWSKIKSVLSNVNCIPTSHGMKVPNESYIRSENLSDDLPIVKLYLPQILITKEEKLCESSTDYPVSIEFLKVIGCRTIHIPSLASNHSVQVNSDTGNSQTIQSFIQELLQKRKSLSDADLHALKNSECIVGTTLSMSDGAVTQRFIPRNLHFPAVASRLDWKTLPIIDWPDIDPRSREYAFLKELGVQDVPDLKKLIDRIIEEHQQQSKKKDEYKLPLALTFLAEHFQQHYYKTWKDLRIKSPFLPSVIPISKTPNEVALLAPTHVFKDPGPLCPSLLPEVVRCFAQYFDIFILGVKQKPTINAALTVLLERRNELLTVQSAPSLFAYLSRLDSLNRTFVEQIADTPFIPLPGNNKKYAKPYEVFVRAKSSSNVSSNDDYNTTGLIDYVDFGDEANLFLLSVGVLSYPSAEMLANLLIDRHSTFLSATITSPHGDNNSNKDSISAKLQVYTNCLKQLAAVSNVDRKLNSEPLRSRLISKPWCLGYQIVERDDGTKDRTFKIARPCDIYLDDDHQCAIDLRPLCAPDEPELTKLYEKYGCKWLSESVGRTLIHRGRFAETDRSNKLKQSILHRLDMLFVNNRGEKIENADEKRIEQLRNHLFVYEAEGIQCQLSFQKRTVILNSTECSSCALEQERHKVVLYINKHIPALDYIDIASELTRFVYKKPVNSIVHAMSDKLASPLETLKRRGIPVDRLLKSVEQQPLKIIMPAEPPKPDESINKVKVQQAQPLSPISTQPVPAPVPLPQSTTAQRPNISTQPPKTPQHNHEMPQQSLFPQGSFLNSLKNLFVPPQSSTSNESREPHQSTLEINRVDNFGRHQPNDNLDMNELIGRSRPYVKTELNQAEHSKVEVNNSCEFVPATNMIRYESVFHGIPLYVDRNVTVTSVMINQAKQLSWLLVGLATKVFKLPIETIHLFRDVDSPRIAFNSSGSLFFNLRYFEQVYADRLNQHQSRPLSSAIPIVRTIVNFYYVVTCHELSHNLDSNHDLNFISHLENVSVRFMDAKDSFLMQFSFEEQ